MSTRGSLCQEQLSRGLTDRPPAPSSDTHRTCIGVSTRDLGMKYIVHGWMDDCNVYRAQKAARWPHHTCTQYEEERATSHPSPLPLLPRDNWNSLSRHQPSIHPANQPASLSPWASSAHLDLALSPLKREPPPTPYTNVSSCSRVRLHRPPGWVTYPPSHRDT